MPDDPPDEHSQAKLRAVAWVVLVFLVAGMVARTTVFGRPHAEGDEVLYRVLMSQVAEGRGYTLRGHPVLESGRFPPALYGGELFPQHPPGGTALFLLADVVHPGHGASSAQQIAYLLFFAGMLLLWTALAEEIEPLGMGLVAGLSAFSPVAAHVFTKQWFDGPLLGFTTLACGIWLHALRRDSLRLAAAAGLTLGAAAWMKMTALGVVPWLLLLGWVQTPAGSRRRWVGHAALLVGLALAALLPWKGMQWYVLGTPFVAAVPPSEELLSENLYLRWVTIHRSPLFYFQQAPIVFWSLTPSLLLLWLGWDEPRTRRLGGALVVWVAGTLATYALLGALGYSKLMRYVILATPAVIALAASTVVAIVERRDDPRTPPVLALAALGIALEVTQGIVSSLVERGDVVNSLAGHL